MTIKEYNECVEQYADSVYRFILKNIKDKEKAEDIVQDTFEKIWLKVSDIAAVNAKSYLFTSAYRTMIDAIRKDKKTELITDAHSECLQVHNSDNKELKEVLDHALTQLPDIQRSVVLLRDYEGYNYKEIGEITGLSEPQVKVYIYRARIALREIIGNLNLIL